MGEQSAESRVIAFGHFEADLRTEELRKRGFPVRLPAQSFQVLRLLLIRPGELVTRHELQKALWPNDSFGDFEHGLNAAVNRLRDALGDSADNPRFIETLPRRGYRLIASVEEREELSAKTAHAQLAVPPEPQKPTAPEPAVATSTPLPTSAAVPTWRMPALGSARFWLLAGSGLVLFAAIGVAVFMKTHGKRAATLPANTGLAPELVPLTSLVGGAWQPALSPDGSQVAFSWDRGRADGSADLFVKVIGAERIQQLTHGLDGYLKPAWSPDGRTIAFVHVSGAAKRESGIFAIPALGGPERKLADGHFTTDTYPSIGWTPDSRNILYSDLDGVESVALETGDVHRIYAKPKCENPSMAPSPDGNWIALDCLYEGVNALRIISTTDGKQKDLISYMDEASQLAWSSDSERVIYNVQGKLAEIGKEGDPPHILDFTHDAFCPSVALRGDRLAYAQGVSTVNIWRLKVAGPQMGSATREMASSSAEREPDISPDGRQLAFVSSRSGFEQIWTSALDGSDAVQLTRAHSLTGTPRWSPDGKTILFDSRECGRPCLYVVDPERGVPRGLSTGTLEGSMPRWSRDGRWIYFTGVAGNATRLYKVALNGGAPQLVSRSAGFNAQETRDGTRLYFFANPRAFNMDGAIHVLDEGTGVEEPLPGMPTVHFPIDWALGSKGIYFLEPDRNPVTISFYRFSTKRVEKHWPLRQAPPYWGGIALSPDETWIAYPQEEHAESNLMLIEGYR